MSRLRIIVLTVVGVVAAAGTTLVVWGASEAQPAEVKLPAASPPVGPFSDSMLGTMSIEVPGVKQPVDRVPVELGR